MEEKLLPEQGERLVRLARTAIANRLGKDLALPQCDDAYLREGGTFVTLKKKGQLRGCIGNITPVGSIWESVRSNAVSAAFFDTRFSEVSEDELGDIDISVSILTAARKLVFEDGAELCRKLRPHIDGVILRKGRNSSTFLPQVWEQLPEPEIFLSHLCQKAGLSHSCWRDGTIEVEIYEVQSFTEEKI